MASREQAAVPEHATKAEVEELRSLVEAQREMLEAALPEGGEEPVIEVLHDPYEQDVFSVEAEIPPDAEYPNGQVVCVVNPALRDRAGSWKDWVPFQYGDKYTGERGERLAEYGIPVPVRTQAGMAKLDSYVRYGDGILCRCDRVSVERRRRIASLRGQNRVSGTAKPVSAGRTVIEGPGLVRGRKLKEKNG